MSRPVVLCVDDEPQVLEALDDLLSRRYRVLTTTQAFEGLRLLRDEPVEVLLSDMRMPVLDGGKFLGMARLHAPDVTRIVLTGEADTAMAMTAVNDGEVFRFLTKPIARDGLIEAITAGVQRHRVRVAEREVLESTLNGAIEVLTEVVGTPDPQAQGRTARVTELVATAGVALELDDTWALDVAARVSQVGTFSLPPQVASRLAEGHPLSVADRAAVRASLRTAAGLLRRIPRLDSAVEILEPAAEPTTAALLLRAALDLDLLCIAMAPDDALTVLRDERELPHDVLDALGVAAGAAGDGVVREHALADIPVGSTFAGDVRVGGTLLVARGVKVTPAMVLRLGHLAERHPRVRAYVHPPAEVVRPLEAATVRPSATAKRANAA